MDTSPPRTDASGFHVEGLDCPDEVAKLRAALAGCDGIGELSFNLMQEQLIVRHEPSVISADDIVAMVGRTGMRATLLDRRRARSPLQTGVPRGPVMMAVLAALGTVAGIALGRLPGMAFHHTTLPAAVAYLLAMAAAWRYIAPKAWSALRAVRLDMNVLMTVAVTGAVGIGEWFEASTVAFLFLVSHVLETWSVGRARHAIQSLMEQSPPTARVKTADGTEHEVDPAEVCVGDHIIVLPGEKFALDGEVVEGHTSVNQAPITGESMPVEKTVGGDVFAGTINGDGAVVVRVTKAAGDTVLAGVIRLVERAQSRRSASERFVDRFARIYTPAVVTGAALLAVVPPLLFAADGSTWFYRALVLLVIACPCALVISTPVSVVSGLTAAARRGVLVKGGDTLEAIGDAAVVAIDKTGTLTRGRPVVDTVLPLNSLSEDQLLRVAAAIEQRSEHPIAKAIVEHARHRGVTPPACENYLAVRGKGAVATVDDREYVVGNHRLLEETGLCTEEVHQAMLAHEDCRHTVVAVAAISSHSQVLFSRVACDPLPPLGLILLTDQLRPDASDAVAHLHQLGVDRIVMLTGDNEGTAKAIADELGSVAFRAELLPADKVAAIEELKSSCGTENCGTGVSPVFRTKYAADQSRDRKGAVPTDQSRDRKEAVSVRPWRRPNRHRVVMVGDGINDAPALAAADFGIAMGSAGTDAALETADIALMSDDLRRIPWLIGHSRRTKRIIVQNITLALAIKAIVVALAIGGLANLWMAIAADMGASLLVTFNGLRALSTSGISSREPGGPPDS